MTEAELQKGVIELARLCGWLVAHFRPALSKKGWRTPVAADGKGFPDLVLVRDRVAFVELKGEGGQLRLEQEKWLARLREAGAEVYLWTPVDWRRGDIELALR